MSKKEFLQKKELKELEIKKIKIEEKAHINMSNAWSMFAIKIGATLLVLVSFLVFIFS